MVLGMRLYAGASYSPNRLSGSVAQCIGYALYSPAPPFPVIVLGFAINGFGLSVQVCSRRLPVLNDVSNFSGKDAGANGFVASMKDNAQVKMGLLHAAYGADYHKKSISFG